jgi:hypothetical protein
MNKQIIIAPLLLLLMAQLSFGTTPFQMNINPNTAYQNTNSTPLSIYVVTHSAQLTGYLGNSITMPEVMEMTGGSVTISNIVYSLAGYNMSGYMLVEPQSYYKFNFTSANFIGQYAPATSIATSNNVYLVSTTAISAPQYSTTAQLLFAAGLILSVVLLLLVFRILKFNIGIMGGLAGFAVGMVSAVLLIFSLQFTSLVKAQPYTINALSSTLSVQAQTATTTLLATQPIFAIIGYSFILMDFILGFIYLFLAMLVYRNDRIKRKYGK